METSSYRVEKRKLEFERVLHVPDLRSNLFSVLYLTVCMGYTVKIAKGRMSFIRSSSTLFTASINSDRMAPLNGYVVPSPESANAALTSTPLNLDLWHPSVLLEGLGTCVRGANKHKGPTVQYYGANRCR